ncbi:hypothetical protein LI221_05550 [Faecalimonas umbilicata]|nr:hypothetical protein [Faecalimonas umbilicata]
MDEIKSRISGIYNDCWKIYKEFLQDYDMDKYNRRAQELTKKYGCRNDIKDMVLWWAPSINRLHDIHVKGMGTDGRRDDEIL